MIYNISHRSSYRYGAPVAQSQHIVHLAPRQLDGQTVVRHSLLIDPAPAARTDELDYFGNPSTILIIEEEHHEFVVHARSTVDVIAPIPVALSASMAWEQVTANAALADGSRDLSVLQYACASRHTPVLPEVIAYARASFAQTR